MSQSLRPPIRWIKLSNLPMAPPAPRQLQGAPPAWALRNSGIQANTGMVIGSSLMLSVAVLLGVTHWLGHVNIFGNGPAVEPQLPSFDSMNVHNDVTHGTPANMLLWSIEVEPETSPPRTFGDIVLEHERKLSEASSNRLPHTRLYSILKQRATTLVSAIGNMASDYFAKMRNHVESWQWLSSLQDQVKRTREEGRKACRSSPYGHRTTCHTRHVRSITDPDQIQLLIVSPLIVIVCVMFARWTTPPQAFDAPDRGNVNPNAIDHDPIDHTVGYSRNPPSFPHPVGYGPDPDAAVGSTSGS